MKLIVVSNRLPLTVTQKGDGFNYKKTSGGLVTGIESLSRHISFVWLGNISGMDLTDENKQTITKDCWEKFHSVPVFISNALNDSCYNGFCNAILWPTLHSFPDDVCFGYSEYNAYKEYNRIFAEKILETAEDNDIVWVHDYHLMLVPEMLKSRNPTLRVMFFLHIAFCEPHLLYPLLTSKSEIIRSVCSSDVIGFHMPDYALNFRNSARQEGINTDEKIKAIPIGIDPEMFRKCLEGAEAKAKIEEYRTRFAGKRIILGVDRTDYIKGLPHKIKGFQRYMERNPSCVGKIVLLQVAIPSRQEVREYSSYTKKINEIVAETNGQIGGLVATPIHFLFNSVSFAELCAIYAVSDMILITSLTDGMNLVALEYVACQDKGHGVVILSRFAGASATLQGCIEHNPCNTEEVADAIERGLSLLPDERKKRHAMNKRNVDMFTSVRWAEDNLEQVYKEWRSEISVKKE